MVDKITAQLLLERLIMQEYQRLFEAQLSAIDSGNQEREAALEKQMFQMVVIKEYFLDLMRNDQSSGK